MLDATIIGFMLGAGVATWVYTKVMRRTGGNTKNSILVAGMAGFFAFVLAVTTLAIIDSYLQG